MSTSVNGSASAHATPRLSVAVITACRSEYGAVRWVLEELRNRSTTRLQLVVTGAHLSERHGLTVREIEADGFDIVARISAAFDDDRRTALAEGVGALVGPLARTLERLAPDVVLIMGDRYEMLAVLTACVLTTTPIAHVSGGEVTEGVIDEQIRHALTKAAHLHFVSNAEHGRRVRQMGEEPWRICDAGEPGLDAIRRLPLMSRDALCRELGLSGSGPIGLVTYHPVTLQAESCEADLAALETALRWFARERNARLIFTHPNADAGNRVIVARWERMARETPGSVLVESLGHVRYLSVLAAADVMVGNSSSGLIEAPSFNLPVVNVGDRQAGRVRGANVIDVAAQSVAIVAGIEAALSHDRTEDCANPYGGDGQSSARIVDFIEMTTKTRSRAELLRKRFVDVDRFATKDEAQ